MDTVEISPPNLEVCKVWDPIRWSSKDTPETAAQAKENNASRLAWGCPR